MRSDRESWLLANIAEAERMIAHVGDHPIMRVSSEALKAKWEGQLAELRLEEAAREFGRKMRESEAEMPPEVARILNENFWDLVSTETP